jgi:putative transposase
VPRKPREELAGGLHHVFARGNDRQAIFVDDVDRQMYLALLAEVAALLRWRCLTYCLMNNHVHLLMETPLPNLGTGMHRLQGGYARNFNRRHRRSGHVFQERYGCVRVEDDAQLWMTVGYIARNPVAAGLCASADDWTWSGHSSVRSGDRSGWLDVDRLLEYFGAWGGDAGEQYEECVAPSL